MSLLHRLFSLSVQWGYLEKNVCTGISKFQENNKHQRFLSNEEIRNLFSAADTDENIYAAAYIKILLLTGVRRSEGLGMKWEHLQLDGPKRMWYLPHTKSGKSRYVILNPMDLQILSELPKVQGNPYVFVGKVQGNAIQNPMKAFKRIIARAEVESTFRLHDIRHTVASLYDVQAALGHANSSISERYAHLSSESMTKTSDNISNVVSGAIARKNVEAGLSMGSIM